MRSQYFGKSLSCLSEFGHKSTGSLSEEVAPFRKSILLKGATSEFQRRSIALHEDRRLTQTV